MASSTSTVTVTTDAGLKLLTSPPVFDVLYALCSPGVLARIAKTCAGAHEAVDNYLTHSLDVNQLLLRFFPEEEVPKFRTLQAELEFLISGSTALQLLDRTVYPNSDLDLYTFPMDAEVLGYWLIDRGWRFYRLNDDGLTFEESLDLMPPLMEHETERRRTNREQYDQAVIRQVFHFCRPRYEEDDDYDEPLKIQIIVSDVCPLQGILAFHSTVVMNYIAWDHACSFYPLATFEERRTLVTYDRGRSFRKAIDKYVQRGFRVETVLSNHQMGAFRFGPRFVGDGQCWTVKLNTTGVVPQAQREPLDMRLNGWQLYFHPKHLQSYQRFQGRCEIYYQPLVYAEFRYRYCMPGEFIEGVLKWARSGEPGTEAAYGEAGFTHWDVHLPRLKERWLAFLARQNWWLVGAESEVHEYSLSQR